MPEHTKITEQRFTNKKKETLQKVAQGTHQNTTNNLIDNRNKERLEKLIRQKALIDDLVKQFGGEKKFEGVLPTLRKQKIPYGTYQGWLSDEDFIALNTQVRFARNQRMKDIYFKAMFTGKNVHIANYVLGALNRLDEEFTEKIAHSGLITNLQVQTNFSCTDLGSQSTNTSDAVEQHISDAIDTLSNKLPPTIAPMQLGCNDDYTRNDTAQGEAIKTITLTDKEEETEIKNILGGLGTTNKEGADE